MILALEEVLPTVYCIYDPSSENLIDLIAKHNNNYCFCHFTAAILAPLPRDTNKASPYLKNCTLSDLNPIQTGGGAFEALPNFKVK